MTFARSLFQNIVCLCRIHKRGRESPILRDCNELFVTVVSRAIWQNMRRFSNTSCYKTLVP